MSAERAVPGRPAATIPVAVALGAAAVLLVALPPGAYAGSGSDGVGLGGLSRAVCWMVLLGIALTLAASRASRGRVPGAAWVIPALGGALALGRMPVVLVGLILLAALVVPRLAELPASTGWYRVLVLAGLACAGVVAAGAGGRAHGDETIAGAVVLGFLAAAGMAPFGWHMLRWLEGAPAELAALVTATLLPGVAAALVAAQPILASLHEAQRAGLLLGGFGAATAVAGAIYAMGASDWRGLAMRTVPGEVGLALVGIAAFDTRGLQAAALTLTVLVCTRPALLFVDAIGPRRGSGLLVTAITLLGAAGLPPTLGFPARLLVLGAAARVHPAVAGLVVAAMVLELAAISIVLRRRLAEAPPPPTDRGAGSTRVLAGVTALVLLGGGVFPGVLVTYVFRLTG